MPLKTDTVAWDDKITRITLLNCMLKENNNNNNVRDNQKTVHYNSAPISNESIKGEKTSTSFCSHKCTLSKNIMIMLQWKILTQLLWV